MRIKEILVPRDLLYNYFKRYLSATKEFHRSGEYIKTLPVFDYETSRKDRYRIYAWGSTKTGALGVRYVRQQTFQDTVRHPKRLGFGEKYNVTSIACGFGFTVFSVDSSDNLKVYGTGLNTDSQIGHHEINNKPLEFIFFPQPITIPFSDVKQTKIKKISAGRAHLAVLTNKQLFMLGNNGYGQCGRRIIEKESYFNNHTVHCIPNIDGKTVVDIVCGQDHTVAITADGAVYSCGWGADGQTGLGHYNSTSRFTRIRGDIENEEIVKISCRSDFVMALNNKGEVFGWGNTEYGQISTTGDVQQVATPMLMKSCIKLGKVKDVASGGSFCMVVNDKGHVYVWGFGLLGVGPRVQQSTVPIQIPPQLFGLNDFSPNNYVTTVECGLSHLAAITTEGDLYMWGRNREYCLGLGSESDQHFPLKVAIGGKTKQVSCGFDHTVAVCSAFTSD